ncbi:MAG: polysaccharide deacetylase family protein [Rhodoblastus sp.]
MPARLTPILMYHSIDADPPERFAPFAVSPARFDGHLRLIREEGFRFLSVSEFVGARDLGQIPERAVVLTFDDGFADFYYEAAPILARHDARATLYAVAGLIGKTSRWLEEIGAGASPMLTWRQLCEVGDAGVEIGAHSMTHPALDCIPLERAREEILQSRRTIEEALSIEVRSFAYPFGYYSRAVRDLLPVCGYRSGCAVGYAHSGPDDDVFALRRHIVRGDTADAQLLAILHGSIPSAAMMFDRLRSQAWGLVRRRYYKGGA